MEELTTVSAVIEKLGGLTAVGKLTGRTTQAVWNWTSFKSFPANTYTVMNRALRAKGYTAPASLWRMVEAS